MGYPDIEFMNDKRQLSTQSNAPSRPPVKTRDPIRLLVIRFGSKGTSALITAFSAVTAVLLTLTLHQLVTDEPITARLIYIPAIAALIIAPMASYYAIKLLSELIDAEEENARVVRELSESLRTVQQLQGLLPICAWCKKIRDQEGTWQPLESYISSHSEAVFSHGICTECKVSEASSKPTA